MSDPRRPAEAAILRKLDRALRTGHLVRLHRTIPDTDPIDGFVVAASSEWTVLAESQDLALDGFAAVRTADISRVRKRGDEDCLTIRALRRRGQWPAPRPQVTCDDLRDLLTTAAHHHGLLAVHLEHRTTDALWIGSVTRLGRKSLHLHEVDPDAHWHGHPTKFRLNAITRLDFAGHYERTLAEFAGPAPTDA